MQKDKSIPIVNNFMLSSTLPSSSFQMENDMNSNIFESNFQRIAEENEMLKKLFMDNFQKLAELFAMMKIAVINNNRQSGNIENLRKIENLNLLQIDEKMFKITSATRVKELIGIYDENWRRIQNLEAFFEEKKEEEGSFNDGGIASFREMKDTLSRLPLY